MKIIEILLVEDNPADIELTKESLRDSFIVNSLHVAMDGEEALNFLFKKGKFADVPTPDLIFLDLNLPKTDGREVLRRLKEDPELRKIPIVVLTSSKAEEDILQTYDLHANCFVSKPIDLDQFTEVVRKIEDFWFGIVRLPGRKT